MCRIVLFTVWFSITAVVGARLAALHLVPLPQPEFQESVASEAEPRSTKNSWSLTHILAVNCPCSQRIADHLLSRGVVPNVIEDVWILGSKPDLAGEFDLRGFHVSTVDPDQLAARTGIQGGPWLLIRDPLGKLVYSGGYAARPLNDPADARDLELLDRVRNGEHPVAWPAFGCAASHSWQRKIDPLGFKY